MPNSLRSLVANPLIFPIYVPSVIFSFCLGLLIPVLPVYALDFGVSYGLIGLLVAGESIGRLLGDVPAGMLLRQFGQKRAMLIGLGLAILSTVALFWAGSIPEAVIYRLLTGFGAALFNISRHAYLAEQAPLTNRGRAIAIFGGVNRIGKFMGPAVGGFVGLAYGIRAPFMVFGLIGLVALLLVIIFDRSVEKAAGGLARPQTHHLVATIKANSGVLATAGSGQVFAQMIRAGRDLIIPLYGADILGLDVGSIGLIVSIAGGIDMLLFYPAGLLMDRQGRKFAIVPCFLLQAIGMALIPFTAGFTGLLAVTSLIGFGNGLGSGTMMTLGADLAPVESRGEFLGVWRLIGDVGASGAPVAVGWIAAFLVLQTAIWTVSLAGFVSVAIFAFLVPETLHQHRAQPSRLEPTTLTIETNPPGGKA
jgi:MFS family permease